MGLVRLDTGCFDTHDILLDAHPQRRATTGFTQACGLVQNSRCRAFLETLPAVAGYVSQLAVTGDLVITQLVVTGDPAI